MKTMGKAVAFFVLCLTWALPAHSDAGVRDGTWLVSVSKAHEKIESARNTQEASELLSQSWMFAGYVMGVADAFDEMLFSLPSGAGYLQIAAVVRKYLADHPEKWNQPAYKLTVEALNKAFPRSDQTSK